VAVPIVATPILGVIMDLFGQRIFILTLSAIFLILSCVLLDWTYVNATVGMVFYSISLAFGPIGMITAIGMILPSDYIGTGLGLYKSSNNIGTTILDIVVGVVQDHTANQAYTNVMILFLALSCVGLLLIIGLWVSQYFFLGNLLETGRRRRTERMKEKSKKEIELNRQGLDSFSEMPVNPYNYLFLAFLSMQPAVKFPLKKYNHLNSYIVHIKYISPYSHATIPFYVFFKNNLFTTRYLIKTHGSNIKKVLLSYIIVTKDDY
jgi:MFS family permease